MDNRDKVILEKILEELSIIATLIESYDCPAFINDEKLKELFV